VSCSCGDKDYPSCFAEKTRRARKPHQCCECGAPIAPGDHYVHSSGVWDNEPNAYSTCVDCHAWKRAFMAHPEGCSCVCFGELWREIAEFTREVLEYDDDTGETVAWARPAYQSQLVVQS
jgi:hypothetical protein